jgi:hypothetical protein
VYAALDLRNGRSVAIKQVSLRDIDKDELLSIEVRRPSKGAHQTLGCMTDPTFIVCCRAGRAVERDQPTAQAQA